MNKIVQSFINFMKIKQKENERDLEFFESDLFYFLTLLYVRGTLNKATIKKKRRMSEDTFNMFEKFAREKKYISLGIDSLGTTYSITIQGTDYLLGFKKLRQEKRNSSVIMWTTIILAISAIISIIDLFISKPTVKEYILTGLGKIIVETIQIILEVSLTLFGGLVIIFIITKIADNRRRKKNAL